MVIVSEVARYPRWTDHRFSRESLGLNSVSDIWQEFEGPVRDWSSSSEPPQSATLHISSLFQDFP